MNRRHFLTLAAAALPAFAQTPADLLITGGHLIDPAQKLDGPFDIAVTNGKISAVSPSPARLQARQTFDATGRIVTPGLIDMHGHVFDSIIPTSIDADLVGLPHGVTTIVDAGSSGALTFPGFRKFIVNRVHERIYALLNISSIGLVVQNELYIDPKLLDAKAAIKTIQDNRDVILGIKVRITGHDDDVPHDIGALKIGREASDATGVPIMLHWTDDVRLLSLLKRGDILVHPFNPPRSGPNLLGADGKVLPQILELKDRGIFTDFAHGTHLQWETAEKAAQQGWFPDTISTDIHRAHAAPNGAVIDLVTTMSKFLTLGLPMKEVITRVTQNPARILAFPEKIGTLAVGNPADISILNVESGDFDLLDSLRQKRVGHQRITAAATVRGGELTRL